MFWYILKLILLLPLIGVMIWGSLKLAQRLQGKFGVPQGGSRAVRIVDEPRFVGQELAQLASRGDEGGGATR